MQVSASGGRSVATRDSATLPAPDLDKINACPLFSSFSDPSCRTGAKVRCLSRIEECSKFAFFEVGQGLLVLAFSAWSDGEWECPNWDGHRLIC